MKKILCFLMIMTLALVMLLVACNQQEQQGSEQSYSEGLEFVSNGDGTCYVSGIGTCEEIDVIIPQISPSKEKVTSIGAGAFCDCIGLASITIPDSVTSIGERAFYECTGLTEIVIPDSIAVIGNEAFYGCNDLLINNANEGVIYFGNETNPYVVFIGFVDEIPNSYSIHDNTRVIYNDAFKYKINTNIGDHNLTSITIPQGLKSIGECAFLGCDGLTSITIPDSVINIGKGAFAGCDSLTSINIPDSITVIGESVFDGCTGLTSITLPDSVISIGDASFYGCTGLTSITIPDSVTSIGEAVFSNCTGLDEITFGNGIKSIGENVFTGCSNLKYTVFDGVYYLGNDNNPYLALMGPVDCSQSSYTICESTRLLADSAFSGCENLTDVSIPDNVISIGQCPFSGCSNLKSMSVSEGNNTYHSAGNCIIETESKTLVAGCQASIIPEDGSVTTIGDRAFSGCTGLTAVTIPNGVISIGKGAFGGCKALVSVVIPNSVNYIGSSAFRVGPKSALNVYFAGTEGQWAEISEDAEVPRSATIHYDYVPEE